jgi:hypothetical protein
VIVPKTHVAISVTLKLMPHSSTERPPELDPIEGRMDNTRIMLYSYLAYVIESMFISIIETATAPALCSGHMQTILVLDTTRIPEEAFFPNESELDPDCVKDSPNTVTNCPPSLGPLLGCKAEMDMVGTYS